SSTRHRTRNRFAMAKPPRREGLVIGSAGGTSQSEAMGVVARVKPRLWQHVPFDDSGWTTQLGLLVLGRRPQVTISFIPDSSKWEANLEVGSGNLPWGDPPAGPWHSPWRIGAGGMRRCRRFGPRARPP